MSTSLSDEITDVVVIGAGMAGLAAARSLEMRGREVIVVEAQARVGGRVKSSVTPGGRRYEAGGQFISAEMTRVRDLLKQCGLPEVASSAGEATVVRSLNGTSFRTATDLDHGSLLLNGIADAKWSVKDLIRNTWTEASAQALARSVFSEYLCADPDDVNAMSASKDAEAHGLRFDGADVWGSHIRAYVIDADGAVGSRFGVTISCADPHQAASGPRGYDR